MHRYLKMTYWCRLIWMIKSWLIFSSSTIELIRMTWWREASCRDQIWKRYIRTTSNEIIRCQSSSVARSQSIVFRSRLIRPFSLPIVLCVFTSNTMVNITTLAKHYWFVLFSSFLLSIFICIEDLEKYLLFIHFLIHWSIFKMKWFDVYFSIIQKLSPNAHLH